MTAEEWVARELNEIPLTEREKELQAEGYELQMPTLMYEDGARREARWMREAGHEAEAVFVKEGEEYGRQVRWHRIWYVPGHDGNRHLAPERRQ